MSYQLPSNDPSLFEDCVEVECEYYRQLFPKSGELGEPGCEWGLACFIPKKILRINYVNIPTGQEGFESGELVVNGTFSFPLTYGNKYKVVAKRSNHPKYGWGFNLMYVEEIINLTDPDQQRMFLATFLTPTQLDNLYETFPSPFDVIKEQKVEELCKVKGIGKVTAEKIIMKYNMKAYWANMYITLAPYEFTQDFIDKLIRTLGDPNTVIDLVTRHPYQLIKKVPLVGFLRADEIASKSPNFYPKSPERIEGYIVYYLQEKADEGMSYVTAIELLTDIFAFFGGKENIQEKVTLPNGEEKTNIAIAIENLQTEGIICVEESDNKSMRRIYLKYVYELEQGIARELKRLLAAPAPEFCEELKAQPEIIEDRIKEQEILQGFEFDETQRKGIYSVLDDNVTLITGGGGTGKSSLLAGILSVLREQKASLTALSGKASANLKEITGYNSSTIHKLLKWDPALGQFLHNRDFPLDSDIIVVDEISMVGGEIFYKLVSAIRSGSKLILIGDFAQLEAIGLLNLGKDFYESPAIPTIELTTIHRQAKKSGIITSSYDVRNQIGLTAPDFEGKQVVGENKDMVFDFALEKKELVKTALKYFDELYAGPLVNRDIDRIEILSPVNVRGESSVYKMNVLIQDRVNPIHPKLKKYIETLGDKKFYYKDFLNSGLTFAEKHHFEEEDYYICRPMGKTGEENRAYYMHVNDKVMCIANNYGLVVPIFNGWTGKIEEISENIVKVFFPIINTTVEIGLEDFTHDFVLAYASTVHKAQGQTIPVVIGILSYDTPPMMLTNNMTYTLITRASKYCVLVGQTGAVSKSVFTNFVSQKRTFMREFLEDKLPI